MNARRGKKDQFEIVWVSRCRDIDSFSQYFTHMKWLALPPEEAMGPRGQRLSNMYKVKGIPSLVLLDEVGQIITTDARNKIPQDKAGIGFPYVSNRVERVGHSCESSDGSPYRFCLSCCVAQYLWACRKMTVEFQFLVCRWRNPFATVISTIFPRSLRVMVKSQVDTLKGKFLQNLKALVGLGKPQNVAA
jgi:nucleoredoxin